MEIIELTTLLNEKTTDVENFEKLLQAYIDAVKRGVTKEEFSTALAGSKHTIESLENAIKAHPKFTLDTDDVSDDAGSNVQPQPEPEEIPVLKQFQQHTKNLDIDSKIEEFLKGDKRHKEAALWNKVGWKLNKREKGCVFGYIMLDHKLVKIKVEESTQLDESMAQAVKSVLIGSAKQALKAGGKVWNSPSGVAMLKLIEPGKNIAPILANKDLKIIIDFIIEQGKAAKVVITSKQAAEFLQKMGPDKVQKWVDPKNIVKDMKPWVKTISKSDTPTGIARATSPMPKTSNIKKLLKKLTPNFEKRLMIFSRSEGKKNAKEMRKSMMKIFGNHRKKILGGGAIATGLALYKMRMPCGDVLGGDMTEIREKMAKRGVGIAVKGVEKS